MGNYNITGWSAGGRRPITNGLRAGQFRQMGVPRNASSNIFINNNFGCMGGSYNAGYFDSCCGNGDDSMSKLEKWMLGLGVGGGLLGCIFGAFGKGKSEGAGDTGNADTKAKTDEFAGLKDLYDYKFGKVNDKYCCRIGDKLLEGDSIEDLHNKIKEYNDSEDPNPPAQQPTTPTPDSTKEPETTSLPKLFDETGMAGLNTVQAVLDKFKSSTNADAVKISDLKDGTITLSGVTDKGNSTTKTGSLQINVSDLKGLADGATKNLGKFGGKEVIACNLNGYIRIQVGNTQTYIVGKEGNNYKGYQFENGNVVGYNDVNWSKWKK